MLNDISTHLLDLLCADARLYAGGSSYRNGWEGVTRPEAPDTTDKPENGWVNVFDSPHIPDSGMRRPAIYLGTRGLQMSDRMEYETCAAPADYTELRALTVLLVICAQDKTQLGAQQQRNQLRQNIRKILAAHRIETNHWYWLDFPGQSGSMRDTVSVSSSGGADQQVAEAMAFLPVVVHYNWSAESPA